MEKRSFSDRMNDTRSRIDATKQEEGARLAQQGNLDRQREKALRMARERMMRLKVEAAQYLRSNGVPTEIGRARIGINGGGFIGYRIPASEFLDVTFPEGWVIRRFTNGDAANVLTPDGVELHVNSTRNIPLPLGALTEITYDRCNDFEVDDNGPYLIEMDHMSEYPPMTKKSMEDEFMKRIAELLP